MPGRGNLEEKRGSGDRKYGRDDGELKPWNEGAYSQGVKDLSDSSL